MLGGRPPAGKGFEMDATRAYGSVLVATDGSSEASEAAEHALNLARALGAKLHVLHVVDANLVRSMGVYSQEAQGELAEEGRHIVDAVLRQASLMEVEAEGVFADGKPGPEICRAAADRGADIVVVGATGKSAIEKVLLGSVSQHVLNNVGKPVLVVRNK
jgi:nucleotide-binding universal stress UspA family protein